MRPLYLWAILPILVFLFSSSHLLLSQCEDDILVIINEIGNNGGGNSGEYVELLVVGDPNNPQSPVDLSGWIIDDNNATVLYKGNEPGHIRLGDCFSAIDPGTLILIYDDERTGTGVNSNENGAPNANGVYQIPFNDNCIVKIEGCPGHYSQNYCTESIINPDEPVFNNYASYWNEFIPMRNAGDVLQLLSPDGTLVHALYWGDLNQNFPPNNYPFKDSDRALAMLSTAEKKSFYLKSSAWNNAADYGNQQEGISPGEANSPENQAFINSIIDGGVFGETMSIECSVQRHVQGEELGIIEIEIIGGLSSYTIELLTHAGQESTTILADNEGTTEITELEAGDYEITVTDARGCEQSCGLTIEDMCEDEYTICPGGSVQIGCLTVDEYCYKWEPEEGLDDPMRVQPIASPEQTTLYTLYVIDDDGNIVETYEATVFISEPVKISPEVILFCEEDEENELSYSPDFPQVVWSTGETSEIIEVNEAGTYSITATDINGCESTDEIRVYDNDNITDEQIAQLLEDAGFMKIPVEILDEPPGFSGSSGAATNCVSGSQYLENLAGEVLIAEGNSSYCLSDAVIGDLELGISEGVNVGGVIMDNFCSGEYTLEDFLAYGNGDFDAVIQVFVMNLGGEDFLFVNTNSYQPFIEPEIVEGIVYPPNLNVIDDLSTGCTYRVRNIDGISWGFYKNEEGRWLQDDIMEVIRRDDFNEDSDPSGDLDNTCCDGESIDISGPLWLAQTFNFTSDLRHRFDIGLAKSNLALGCSHCYEMATEIRDAFYDGETRTKIWQPTTPLPRYLRRLETTDATINQIDNNIESWYRSHDGLFDLFTSSASFFENINNPNYSSLLDNFGGATMIGGTQNLSIKLTTVHEDCETGMVTIIYKLGVGDIFGAGKKDAEKYWIPGLPAQFLLQHFNNDDCTDEISSSNLCYTPLVHWVYFIQIFSFYVGA